MESRSLDKDKLRKLRLERGFTQEGLGALAGITGVQVSRLEAGKQSPSFQTLTALAAALGVATSELLAPVDANHLPGRNINGLPKQPAKVAPAVASFLPLLGIVPGGPLMHVSNTDVVPYPVPEELVRSYPNAFVVKVSGDSMSPVIQDGDVVVVDPTLGWRQGSTIVAEVDGEVTVKCIGEVDGKPALIPNNGDVCNAIVLGGEQQVRIQGIVVEVLRRISVAH